jgi:hypothetical protein
LQEEEMTEELPPETLERLVRRPEDLSSKVMENIRGIPKLIPCKISIRIFMFRPLLFYN